MALWHPGFSMLTICCPFPIAHIFYLRYCVTVLFLFVLGSVSGYCRNVYTVALTSAWEILFEYWWNTFKVMDASHNSSVCFVNAALLQGSSHCSCPMWRSVFYGSNSLCLKSSREWEPSPETHVSETGKLVGATEGKSFLLCYCMTYLLTYKVFVILRSVVRWSSHLASSR